MSLGSGIALAGLWLAAAAVTCVAVVFRESDWMMVAFFAGLLAWFATDDIFQVGRRDDRDEGDEKDSRGADPARS
jgi:hypothetical protein